ncbi:hypothetical protein A4D02_16080 [Niastella koreensis]|uniref:Uncharacterized protein n=3 Tax=Niastella koreensis TaxID=354356 RepID=G8TN69_NIAKG|nr:hypothetical protein Niako_1383 [Niastella koreensis GR20-10]OQP40431.1 hypothetical protein A4D02_16080 [Niastella koreensis]
MKMNYLIKYLLLLIPAFFYSKAFTQSKDLVEKENELIALNSKIDYKLRLALSKGYDSTSYNSVDHNVAVFEQAFTHLITSDPNTIDYPFNKLRDSSICVVTTAADGKMRVYNLNSWQLLTQIYQWKEKGKVYTKVTRNQKDSILLCREIYAIPVNGKRYYLPVTSTIIWPSHAMQSVAAWRINGNSLEPVTLFKNKSKKQDHIEVPFSFYNFAPKIKDSLLAFISYDNLQKKVYIPCVNEKGLFTQRYFIYEVKDGCLELTQTGPHP